MATVTATVYLQIGDGPLIHAGAAELTDAAEAPAELGEFVRAVADEITTPTDDSTAEPPPTHDTVTRPPAPDPPAPRTLLLGASSEDVTEIAARLERTTGTAAEDILKATPKTGLTPGTAVDQVLRTPTYRRLSATVREPLEAAARQALKTGRTSDDR